MNGLNPDVWVLLPRPPPFLLPPHSAIMSHHEQEEEEDEEDGGEHPAVCCCTGCDGVLRPPAQHSSPTALPSSLQPGGLPGGCGDQQLFPGGQHSGGPGMETQRCLCVYGQREPESLHWPGSPHVYYGVRRNLMIGVQVVEEVAVEDTIEVITEDIYTDDLLDPELLQDAQLYPT
ncbi:hypothetical protein PBY51_017143 [Eleginops maclovinus]|uniref:Uncharacterized protein n=1 Tax=Eleginops maclovinus TaxID=56733 RepID=A0AAN8AGB8_ELEMC|nr:hypothetical protein PBY51_017143 [Eleginops maclovinus]